MEGVAVFVCQQVHDGYKPETDELTGIDVVFEKDSTIYIIEIKSGPNWGNSSQISKMVINFKDAIVRLGSQYPEKEIVPVNGCMYGRDANPKKKGKIREEGKTIDEVDYLKLCGQDFWHFISNNKNLYVDIIEPLGHRAKQRNELFQEEYSKLINKFTKEFLNSYCDENGTILWESLTEFVSASKN